MKKQVYLGNLVCNDWNGGIQMYEFAGNILYNRPHTPTSRFKEIEIAIIIELSAKYLTSVKILTQNGDIGWVNKNFLTLID